MWPILIVTGLAVLIAEAFSNGNEKSTNNEIKKIFISFAIEDETYRDYLVEQSKNERSTFNFVDMSVKKTLE